MNQDVASPFRASRCQYRFCVVGQIPKSLSDRAAATAPQQVHHDRSQEGEHRRSDPVGVAMGDLTQLDRATRVQCHSFSATTLRIRHSSASGAVRMLVSNLCCNIVRFPFRIDVVVITYMIQALPGQLALMCSGACFRFAEDFCYRW